MYELSVERDFCAAHAIMIRGEREPVHGHTWRVRIEVAGAALDADGLLCDFHEIERSLDAILAPFRDRHLNEIPPFDARNPTAELVARFIGDAIVAVLPTGVRLVRSSVTEAPGCIAAWRPDAGGERNDASTRSVV